MKLFIVCTLTIFWSPLILAKITSLGSTKPIEKNSTRPMQVSSLESFIQQYIFTIRPEIGLLPGQDRLGKCISKKITSTRRKYSPESAFNSCVNLIKFENPQNNEAQKQASIDELPQLLEQIVSIQKVSLSSADHVNSAVLNYETNPKLVRSNSRPKVATQGFVK